MSELQISLIALGVLVILAIVAFNWWQDRRARRKMQDSLPDVGEDALLSDGDSNSDGRDQRLEPGLGKLGLVSQASDDQDTGSESSLGPMPAVEPDSMTEAVIELHLTQALTGSELTAHLNGGLDTGRRPVRMLLQTAEGHLSNQIMADQPYTTVQLAVLLANRAGPLTAIEWSQIWGKAQSLADKLEASVDGPEQNDVLARADDLDSTCATLDAQVTLTLVLHARRAIEDLVGTATAMGFVDDTTHLSWIGDHGLACFTLFRADGQPLKQAGSHVDQLTLLLDVPRSPANPVSFARMMEVGQELGRRIGGDIVDDQHKPLAPGADVAIDQQLQALYAQLEAAGLTAGGERARRVFSG